MSDQQERPDLNRRRRPQPAPDERVDPVDYRQEATSALVEAPTAATVTHTPPVTAPAQRGRPRREATVPFSTRIAPDVYDLLDAAVAAGVDGTTIRAVLEAAIREKYGKS
jgi:hypothetical protein